MSERAASSPPRVRTVFCTCGGLNGALVLRRLRACKHLEICAIIRSSRVFSARFGFMRGALAQIGRSGLGYGLYLWCVTTLADWLCGRGGLESVPLRTARSGTPVLTTRDINSAQSLEFVADFKPDLLVSAFFNQRIHPAALALPTYGCLNIHPSLLPDAKGVDPVFQGLLREVPALGVTVHFMDADFDTGRIVAQRSIEHVPNSSVLAMTAKLFDEGAILLAAAMESIVRGSTGAPQGGPGTYQSWPTRLEQRRLRKAGRALLHFTDLVRLVRGRLPF